MTAAPESRRSRRRRPLGVVDQTLTKRGEYLARQHAAPVQRGRLRGSAGRRDNGASKAAEPNEVDSPSPARENGSVSRRGATRRGVARCGGGGGARTSAVASAAPRPATSSARPTAGLWRRCRRASPAPPAALPPASPAATAAGAPGGGRGRWHPRPLDPHPGRQGPSSACAAMRDAGGARSSSAVMRSVASRRARASASCCAAACSYSACTRASVSALMRSMSCDVRPPARAPARRREIAWLPPAPPSAPPEPTIRCRTWGQTGGRCAGELGTRMGGWRGGALRDDLATGRVPPKLATAQRRRLSTACGRTRPRQVEAHVHADARTPCAPPPRPPPPPCARRGRALAL